MDKSKTILEDYKKKIDKFLKQKLELTLHPEKSQILKLEKGINFLGFRIFYHHKILAKRNIRKFEKKLQIMKKEYSKNKIEREKIIEKLEGWIAYSKQANTYKQRKRITKKFNKLFPAKEENKITSVKKQENFNNQIEKSKIEFTTEKTLKLHKKGLSIKKIAEQRKLKEGTIWEHIAKLLELHQIKLKEILSSWKIRKILQNIKSQEDTLKIIKERINDNTISYDEINCVLAVIRAKNKKQSINYYTGWYQRTNCYRKCNKKQREECRTKFQQLTNKNPENKFTKKEFLHLMNKHIKICILPKEQKEKHITWKEYKNIK